MFVSDSVQDAHLQRSSVARVRIDEIVPKDLPVQFVKMDVEGAEIAALEGMSGIIRRYHPILVVELNELALSRGDGSTPEELIGLLKRLGYVLREVGSKQEFALPSSRDGKFITNLLCTTPGETVPASFTSVHGGS
jgi:hypothetical protein